MKDALSEAIKRIVLEVLAENAQLSPEYTADLDSVLMNLQATLKALESAHQKAPDAISKTILTGVHSDIFNTAAETRGFIQKLKAGKPQ